MSIIMPAYNAGEYIGAAIGGVLSQTHPDVELVVIDDGSTDDTYRIASGFGDRIVLLQQRNRGQAAARNTGIEVATGDVLALCDSDDVLLPNYVAKALAVLEKAPDRSWVTCAAMLLTDDGLVDYGVSPFGVILPERQREAIFQMNFVSIFSVFPRRMFDQVGPFTDELRRCEDWEYWVRAMVSGWRVAFQTEPAAMYRRHGAGNLSANAEAMMDAEDALFAGIATRLGDALSDRDRALLESRVSHGSPPRLRQRARSAWAAGDFRQAASLLRVAARDYSQYGDLRRKALVAGLAAPVLESLPNWVPLRRMARGRL
ncbi:MAG: glycosyltransferase [Micropruina sp.]